MNLNHEIKELRRARGWSQKMLAEKSAVSQSTISRLEKGVSTNIHMDIENKLTTALGITTENVPVVTEKQKYELEVTQTKALTTLADSVKSIAEFLHGGGLMEIAKGLSISNSANALLSGLTTHDGRQALDARTIGQNAIEIAELVLKVHNKFEERLSEKRDPEIKEPVEEYKPRCQSNT